MPELHIESALPEGWVPEGAVLRVIARRYADGHWEAVALDFSVAGMGRTADGALRNTLELVDEYLCLVARDGHSFEDAVRRVRPRNAFAMFREAAGLVLKEKVVRPDHDRRSQHYRLPLREMSAH